jgi:tetratricopeptide (TPR) repeat protein
LFQEAATAFEKQKREGDALDARIAAAELAPDDAKLRSDVARALIAAGQSERAQPFLSADGAGEDVDLLLAIGRADLLAGRGADAHATLMRVVALAPDRQEAIDALANELLVAGRVADAYACLEILVDAALFEAAFDRAAGILEQFIERHAEVPALLKLVDVYVDAGFDDRITRVQGRLADAYLHLGQCAEARLIAEDLVAREPHDDSHAERLRRALIALGVDDPEEVIARQRESGALFGDELNLGSDDLGLDDSSLSSHNPALPTADADVHPEMTADLDAFAAPGSPAPESRPPIAAPPIAAPPLATPPLATEGDGPAEFDSPPPRETVEIDLSSVLAGLNAPRAGASAGREEQISEAAACFEKAQEHLRRGLVADAAAALQAAARVPQFRFKAAAQLGRLLASRGDTRAAVEWFERAAEAPAPSPDEGFSVLYDLADALDRTGEPVRALAVLIELESDAGVYRDVRTRIEQLSRGTAATSRGLDRERP